MLGTGSFTQAHGHEPCGLVAHAQHALDLLGGDAFLAGGKEVRSKNPLAERDLGALKNGSDRDAELLAAIVALKQAFAVGLTFKPCRVDRAAMRANRTAGPKLIFEMGAGRIVVVVNLVCEIEFHQCTYEKEIPKTMSSLASAPFSFLSPLRSARLWRQTPRRVFSLLLRVSQKLFQRRRRALDAGSPACGERQCQEPRLQSSSRARAEIVLLDEASDDHLGPILRVLGPRELATLRENSEERIHCYQQ